MRLAMESHTGGMPLCGLGAPETERVGATRSHDVEVGHPMGPPSERSHAASRNAITPRRSGLTTANQLRYPSSAEATPELFHGTRDITPATRHPVSREDRGQGPDRQPRESSCPEPGHRPTRQSPQRCPRSSPRFVDRPVKDRDPGTLLSRPPTAAHVLPDQPKRDGWSEANPTHTPAFRWSP